MRIRAEISSKYIVEEDYDLAKLANSLAHPLRVALVRYLLSKNNGKGVDNITCNKDLVEMFDYSQSTISQHLKIMKDSELVITERKDKFTHYYINTELLSFFTESLNSKIIRE